MPAKVIAIANQKGGVMKTKLTVNFGHYLARKGKRTLIIDNDPQGNATSDLVEQGDLGAAWTHFLYQPGKSAPTPQPVSKKLDLLGADSTLGQVTEADFENTVWSLKEAIRKLYNKIYDYILIDTQPTLAPIQLAALNAADYVVVPTQPEKHAVEGLGVLLQTIERVRTRFQQPVKLAGIVIVKRERTTVHNVYEELLRQEHGDAVLRNTIRKGIAVEEAGNFRQHLWEFAPNAPVTKDVENVIKELMERMK